MRTAIPALREFMKTGETKGVIQEIDDPDVPLWAIWAIQQYAHSMGIEKAREQYADFVQDILEYLTGQMHPEMKVLENGLLFANGREKAITWMNSTQHGKPVVRRSGYIVEFNAFWYNALCFYNEMLTDTPVEKYAELIKRINISFPDTFVNGYNYLFD